MCLMEYLPQATAKVQDQIDGAARGMDLKHKVSQSIREYISINFDNGTASSILLDLKL